jgi:hypothetical protein
MLVFYRVCFTLANIGRNVYSCFTPLDGVSPMQLQITAKIANG